MRKTKISRTNVLVVFANPRGTDQLRLGSEDRAIRQAIKLGKYRDDINLTTCNATTIDDLRRALLETQYHIVQISGHGTRTGLVLEDEVGGKYIVPQKALANLFQLYCPPEGSLKCVILNACYSINQGELMALGVSYTVAMEGAIGDRGAIEFSKGFYDAVCAGYQIERAYKEGVLAAQLGAPGSEWVSKLLKIGEIYSAKGPVINTVDADNTREPHERKTVRTLVSLAIDLSGSMTQSIRNNTGGHLSRLESFRQSLDRLVKQAQSTIRENRIKKTESSIEIFAYGFGLRSASMKVCDLLSLIEIGQNIISKSEIERLKQDYKDKLQDKYSPYEGLGGLAKRYLGNIVDDFERSIRAQAEADIRHKIMTVIKNRLESQLSSVGDTTLPVEEVARLLDSSGETLTNAEEFIYGDTPMREAMIKVAERFKRDLETRPKDTIPILFIMSDGEPTDGDPLSAVQTIKELGVTVVSCFVTNQDVANPRTLLGEPNPQWNKGAQLMFDIASPIEDNSEYARFLLKKGWIINPGAKFFIQLNHSEILEEFIRVVLSPFEEPEAIEYLPAGR